VIDQTKLSVDLAITYDEAVKKVYNEHVVQVVNDIASKIPKPSSIIPMI